MARDLGFLKDGYPRTRIRSLWAMDRHEVPEDGGVYIFLSGDGTIFTYPGGRSPVFYIGQSKNLRNRLQDHLSNANQIRDGRRYDRHYSLCEYAAEFGCRYSCIPCLPGDKAKWLEADIMLRFEEQFRALPVACGSGSRDFGEWP